MTTTTIVDFNLSANRPYRITVTPSSPKVGDAIGIIIDSQDDWAIFSLYGALSGKTYQQPQEYEESVDLSGNTALSLVAPVSIINSAITESPLIDVSTNPFLMNESAGAPIKNRLSVRNASVYIDKADLYGSLRINYTAFRSLYWTHDAFQNKGEYVLLAKNLSTNEVERILINVGAADSNESSVPSLVTIQAKDFCTDLPIQDASVYINNVYIGATDFNGKVVAGFLNPGAYSLKIQASGYLATDADELINESFTI